MENKSGIVGLVVISGLIGMGISESCGIGKSVVNNYNVDSSALIQRVSQTDLNQGDINCSLDGTKCYITTSSSALELYRTK
jgi:hypothetical protein